MSLMAGFLCLLTCYIWQASFLLTECQSLFSINSCNLTDWFSCKGSLSSVLSFEADVNYC